jgi:hypothetical protein
MQQVLAKLDAATREFRESVRKKFHGQGEW